MQGPAPPVFVFPFSCTSRWFLYFLFPVDGVMYRKREIQKPGGPGLALRPP